MTTSKRKGPEIEVPEKGQDAAERKRVLNVLAQRRYRQRRRQHLKKLEAQADASPVDDNPKSADIAPSFAVSDDIQFTADDDPKSADIAPSFAVSDDIQFSADDFSLDPQLIHLPNSQWETSLMLPSLPTTPTSSSDESSWSLEPLSSSPDIQYSFPDEANLQVIELALLRGALLIAKRLNIDDLIWSLTATSPFTEPAMALSAFTHLPPNLRPTPVQLNLPHHPILDLLPWPTVRDKLILMFSQPPEVRPKTAASPTALLEFVYDLEDSAEGVRIWGDDPYSDKSWEVGEKLFKNWWWALDGDVIRTSNEMRRSRGAKLLGEGSVLGEVD